MATMLRACVTGLSRAYGEPVLLMGTERTNSVAVLMSATDPKRTFRRRAMPAYVCPLELLF